MDMSDEIESAESSGETVRGVWDQLRLDIWRLPDDLMSKDSEFHSFRSEYVPHCPAYDELIAELEDEASREANYPALEEANQSPLATHRSLSLELLASKEDEQDLLVNLRRISLMFQLHEDVFQVRAFWQNGEDGVFQFPSHSLPVIAFNGTYWRLVNPSQHALDLMHSGSSCGSAWSPPDDTKLLEVVRYYPHSAIVKHPWLLRNILRLFSQFDEETRTAEDLISEFAGRLSNYAPQLADDVIDVDRRYSIFDQDGLSFNCAGNTLCRSFQLERFLNGESLEPESEGMEGSEVIAQEEGHDEEDYDEEDYYGEVIDDEHHPLIVNYPAELYVHLGRSGIKLLHPIKVDSLYESYYVQDDKQVAEAGRNEWFYSYPHFTDSATVCGAAELVDEALELTRMISNLAVDNPSIDYIGTVNIKINVERFLLALGGWVPELHEEVELEIGRRKMDETLFC